MAHVPKIKRRQSRWTSGARLTNSATFLKGNSVAAAPTSIPESEIPPPSFPVLVSMFSTQAAVALGMIPHPVTKQQSVELPIAKHFIGMLTVLEDKTRGNLSSEENTFLERSLHQLRVAYLEVEKKS